MMLGSGSLDSNSSAQKVRYDQGKGLDAYSGADMNLDAHSAIDMHEDQGRV